MSAILLDSRQLAKEKKEMIAREVDNMKQKYGVVPGLVVLIVGDNPASHVYVKNNERVSKSVGFNFTVDHLPSTITQDELLAVIHKYNKDISCHGILVELPLPQHIDEQVILRAVDYHKDVDGFHPMNVGNFFLGNDATVPCTPLGIMSLLSHYNIDVSRKLALVIGRSNIVGKPMGMMLLQKNATVMYAHTHTENLKELTRQADIIVVAIGQAHFITKEDVKQGAIIIDAGINRLPDNTITGDVAKDVVDVAAYVTPVPGGVGPMTITMLLEQTVHLAYKQLEHID